MASLNGFNPKLNQNLWAVVVALGTIGVAEYFNLYTLYWVGIILCAITILSLIFTLTAYSINYWQHKLKQ